MMKSYTPYIVLFLFLLAGSCKYLAHINESSYDPKSPDAINTQNLDQKLVDDAPPATGENSNMYLGNPSNAQPNYILKNNFLINLPYYSLSYDADRGIANWVSWHLNQDGLVSNTSRRDNYAEYQGLPESWHMVHPKSYSGSGFDRGHHCPSADRLTSENANAATFLMINILPQAPNNNQGVWNNFEMYLRRRVAEGNEIYVIMGSYGQGGLGKQGYATRIDSGRVAVPSHIWKIAVILPEGDNDIQRIAAGEAEIIAINTPNSESVSSSWRKYLVTIRDLEKATGHNFLSELSIEIQDKLEIELSKAA